MILDLPAVPAQDDSEDFTELESHHKAAYGDDEEVQTPEKVSPSPGAGSMIKSRQVSLEEARILLREFETFSTWFPFVQIKQDIAIPTLSKTSPFLLLAILTTMTRSNPDLYHQLDHEFRRVLNQKLVVEGKKSLDMLQGLLVYLAW